MTNGSDDEIVDEHPTNNDEEIAGPSTLAYWHRSSHDHANNHHRYFDSAHPSGGYFPPQERPLVDEDMLRKDSRRPAVPLVGGGSPLGTLLTPLGVAWVDGRGEGNYRPGAS